MYVPRRGLVNTREEIKDRRLPRAVRTDQTVDLALTNVHVELVHRDQTAEPYRRLVSAQDRSVSVAVGHLLQTSGVFICTPEPLDERSDLGRSQDSLRSNDHRQDQDQSKDDKPQVGEFECRRADLYVRELTQYLGQKRYDDRPEDRTRHRAHPADHDHDDDLERSDELKIVRVQE